MRESEGDIARIKNAYEHALAQHGTKNNRLLQNAFDLWLEKFFILYSSGQVVPQNALLLTRSKLTPDRQLSLVGRVLRLLSGVLPLWSGCLPGSRHQLSLVPRIQHRLLEHKLKKLPLETCHARRVTFLEKLEGLHSTHSGLIDALLHALPDEFFLLETRRRGMPSRYSGSMECLFQDPWYKIMYLPDQLFITAIAHGGHYGQLKTNRYEEFEQACSDVFLGWGFNRRNIRQNRFSPVPSVERHATSIYFVERVDAYDVFNRQFLPDFMQVIRSTQDRRQERVDHLIAHFGVKLLTAPGKTRSDPLTLSEIDEDSRCRSLFLMDTTGHTFMYEAIYRGYPFILFLERTFLDHVTPRYAEFLSMLHEEQLLYYDDEYDALLATLKNAGASMNFPKQKFGILRSFLETEPDSEIMG